MIQMTFVFMRYHSLLLVFLLTIGYFISTECVLLSLSQMSTSVSQTNNRRLLQTSTCPSDMVCATSLNSTKCTQRTFCPNFNMSYEYNYWDVMHRCGVNRNSMCQVTLISGQSVNAGAYGIERIFDSSVCYGFIGSGANVDFRIDLSVVYDSLNISFMSGQLSDCIGPSMVERTKILKFALGTVSGSEVVCDTYNYPTASSGYRAIIFSDACKGIPARYIRVTGSNPGDVFSLAKLYISQTPVVCPAGSGLINGACIQCAAGTYSPNGACISCPANFYCQINFTTPTACPASTISPANSTDNLQCSNCVSKGNLIARYEFDQSDMSKDTSGNGRTLILGNAPTYSASSPWGSCHGSISFNPSAVYTYRDAAAQYIAMGDINWGGGYRIFSVFLVLY